MMRLSYLSAEDTRSLLAEFSDPAIRSGGGDLRRSRFIHGQVFPSLRKACRKYRIEAPYWLLDKPKRLSKSETLDMLRRRLGVSNASSG